MLKGFKDFLMRGNVVELATAVIIGAAFTAIVTAFTDKIINPLLATIPSGSCPSAPAGEDGAVTNQYMCGFGVRIDGDNPATFMDFGALISAFINFVIVAAVVYFLIVVPFNKLQELRKLDDPEEDPDEQIVLLTQIRNALDPEAKEHDLRAAAAKKAEEEAQEEAEREAQARAAEAREAQQQAQSQQQPQQQPSYQQQPPAAPMQGYGDRTQTMPMPPQHSGPGAAPGSGPQGFTPPAGPPTGGFPTPNPAPGEYPPPGSLPPGQYAPGQYPPPPNDPDGGRHSR